MFIALAALAVCAQAEVHVVGILGGWDRWDDPHRGVRKLVLKLRESPGIHAESFGNHNLRAARKHLLRSLDTNHNGKLEPNEKSAARVVLFGQSLGGAQAIALARDLEKRKVPVLLTVQIDSFGLHDGRIPANVRAAVNFYQKELFTFRGQEQIRAADPSKTRILGNLQFHYPPFLPSYSRPESRARRWLGGAHAKLEADPLLWAQVEAIVRQEIDRKEIDQGGR